MTLLADFKETRRLGDQPLPVVKVGSTYYYSADQDAGQRRYNILRSQLEARHPIINWFAVKLGYI